MRQQLTLGVFLLPLLQVSLFSDVENDKYNEEEEVLEEEDWDLVFEVGQTQLKQYPEVSCPLCKDIYGRALAQPDLYEAQFEAIVQDICNDPELEGDDVVEVKEVCDVYLGYPFVAMLYDFLEPEEDHSELEINADAICKQLLDCTHSKH